MIQVTPHQPRAEIPLSPLSLCEQGTYPDSIQTATPKGRKRLPPYGKELLNARRQGLAPADGVVLVFLDSWGADARRAKAVVPIDLHPADCRFEFIAGLDTFVFWDTDVTPVTRCRELLRELLRYSPSRLCVVGTMGDISQLTWVKSKQRGIEIVGLV